MSRWSDWLEAALPAALYCAAFAALRLSVSPTIGVDDVEQIIATQDLRLGYLPKQPPLYSWYLALCAALAGPGLPALVAAKYTLLFATLVLYHRVAAEFLRERWMPHLATGSLALVYVLGYQLHTGYTHTAMLLFVTALTVWLLLRLCERPSLERYILFGAAIGLGLLSKYNFAGAVVAMLLALGLDPARRHVLLSPRMLATAIAAALVFLPYGLWLLEHQEQMGKLVDQYVTGGTQASALEKRWLALADLGKATVEYLLPFAVLVPLVYRHAWASRMGWRRTWQASPGLRFLTSLVGGGMAVLLALALIGGTRMIERYMVPYLLFAPVLLLALMEARLRAGMVLPVRVRRAQAWHGRLVALLIVAAATGFAIHSLRPPPDCGRCRLQKPYAGLAERLAAVKAGTLIAGDEFIGGNLVPRLGLRAYSLAYPDFAPERRAGEGGCLLVWDAAQGDAPPPALHAFAERIRGEPLPAALAVTALEVPYPMAPTVTHHWRFAALPAAGDCR